MATLGYYLLLDHVKIQNANAISSPLTYGFPAISGFLGAIHALSRKIESTDPIYLDGVLIACHDCDVQVYHPNRFADYTFKLTRNPVGKNGDTRSIIEEGRVHLDVSLVVEVNVEHRETLRGENEQKAFADQIKQKLYQQRIAGGNVVSIERVALYHAANSHDDLINQLLPAYILIEANEELHAITEALQQQDPTKTELDALIETAILHHSPKEDKYEQIDAQSDTSLTQHESKQIKWRTSSVKQGRGWLVPIPLGYQGISPLLDAGTVTETRSNAYPSQFVECIYGLGKWIFPLRIKEHFDKAFWRYQCSQLQSNNSDIYIINQYKA
ncbi:type I-F CRISPR-associated protein Csy2 [Orbaceae bacterium ESL0727]|nr:type I-F CRISPR-associated protein Csy2 [Orbaceae bacterium ESL0727]